MEIQDLYSFIENPRLLSSETLEELKGLTVKYPYFQAGWLLYLKNLKILDHKEFESELNKAAIYVADRDKLYHFLHAEKISSKKIYDKSGSEYILGSADDFDSRKEKESLIDSFIRSQPSIKFGNNSEEISAFNDIAEKSISENDEIITETLANIFIQQKKYDKAIDAFEKLSLKFPEKSSYFAARIEKVKELKNN